MKYLSMLSLFLLFVVSTSGSAVMQPSDILSVVLILILLFIAGYFIHKEYRYRKTAYFLIACNIRALKKHIKRNQNDIITLKNKIGETQQRLISSGAVSEDVKMLIEGNIALWQDQTVIQQDLIHLCEARISTLKTSKNELDLLYHLIKAVKSEPNATKRIEKLEKLIRKIDHKVHLKVNNEVNKLIIELKQAVKKEKIIRLHEQVRHLKSQVG